mgnify:CR=1 FL=1
MRTFIGNTKKYSSLCILVLTMISIFSCDKDEPLGFYTPLKWESNNYSQYENNGVKYYIVSPQGENFQLKCTNHNALRLRDIIIDGNREDIELSDNSQFSNHICEIKIKDNFVDVAFKQNDNQLRKVEISVQSGNAYGSLHFEQGCLN